MEQGENKNRERLFGILLCLAVFAMEVLFFRNILLNDRMLGDTGDARLNNLLAEHWFKFFCGKESFNEIIAFYPVENTLSYTDMVLGFALPYSVLRVFGVGMYFANKIVLVGMHFFGSFCMLFFLRKKIKLTRIWSLVGVAAFSLSSAYSVRINHTQLITISMIPFLLIMIYLFFENTKNTKQRTIYGILAVSWYALMMYTSFYIAFFTILFAGTLLVVYFILLLIGKKQPFHTMVTYVKEYWVTLCGLIVYGIVAVIPFFMMYLPTSKLFGARDWGYIAGFIPKAADLLNVSSKNYLFGGMVKKLERSGVMTPSEELEVGFPVFVLILIFVAFIFVLRAFIKKRKEENNCLSVYMPLAIMLSILLSMILVIKVGDDKSLWYIIYKVVPGGTALRAVGRYLFFLTLPVGVGLSIAGNCVTRSLNQKQMGLIVSSLVLCIVLASNVQHGAVKAKWTIHEETEQLSQVSQPPADCKVMYVIDSARPNREDTYNYHLTAWSIANLFDIKTIDGYSGQFPIGWNLHDINNLDESDKWIGEKKITNIYAYDFATNQWIEHQKVRAFMGETGE